MSEQGIDDFFMLAARKVIKAAAFVGISRRWAMNCWLSIFTICREAIGHLAGKDISWIMVVISLLFLGLLNLSYRDDDVLPNLGPLSWRPLRIILICSTLLMGLLSLPAVLFLGKIELLKILVPDNVFAVYFLLNQGSGSGKTVLSVAKRWLGRFKSELSIPLPRLRQPQPAPVRSFSELLPPRLELFSFIQIALFCVEIYNMK